MGALQNRWRALTAREKRLVGAMLILAAGVFIWLGVVRPINSALDGARADATVAENRAASVRSGLALINGFKRSPSVEVSGPLTAAVEQSASDAGFELQENGAAGGDGAAITIASARAPALFTWLDQLAQQGVAVNSLDVQPAAAGTVTAKVLLRRSR